MQSWIQFNDPEKEQQFVEDSVKFILGADGVDELELIEDMRAFNVRGNTDGTKFQTFWTAMGVYLI